MTNTVHVKFHAVEGGWVASYSLSWQALPRQEWWVCHDDTIQGSIRGVDREQASVIVNRKEVLYRLADHLWSIGVAEVVWKIV